MAHHIALFSDNESHENPSLLPQQSGNAIMTLVKPELSREEALRLMPQLPVRSTVTVEEDTLVAEAENLSLVQNELKMKDMTHAWEWKAHKHGWDYKFAISMIALLIIVNTGLIVLVHQNKGARAVIASHVATMPAAKTAPARAVHVSEPRKPDVIASVPAQPAVILSIPELPSAKPSIARQPSAADNQDLLAILNKQ